MGMSVLVADDDDAIRESVRWILEDAGYTVYEAADGLGVLDRLRRQPDCLVVLLDVIMPGMDGIAVLQAVEAEVPLATRHRYVVMSASRLGVLPPAFRQQLTRLGVPVVPKPFDVDVLLAAVAAAADRVGAAIR